MANAVYPNILTEIRDSVKDGLDCSHGIMQEVARAAPGSLSRYMNELVSRKGKRMRATFVLLIASARGRLELERASKVAASIELLHLATLVHDDIIDESERRRNELTAHKKWGSRVAVLVGDYALSKSLELIINDVDRRIPTSISTSASRLVAGEILEIEHTGNLALSLEQYYEVIYGKTASLWETSGECGAVVAGFDVDMVRACGKLGCNMGMAFQIIDDLLDYGVGAENLGKETHTDLQNGLMTMPLILFFKNAKPEEKDEMIRLLTQSVDGQSMAAIRRLLSQTNSFSEAKELAVEKIEDCFGILERFPDSRFSEYLRELCEILANRSF